MLLSLVVPCFNEEENITAFHAKCDEVFSKLISEKNFQIEYIFVNDGSRDGTAKKLRALYRAHDNISVISFSRNFGKEAAMYAGLEKSKGDFVTIIDADLQQNPQYVIKMLEILQDDEVDSVAAYQDNRKEGKILTFFKKAFYKLINKASDIDFYSGASDFRTLKRNVVDALLEMPEYFRFSKGLFAWVGFNTEYMAYEVEERYAGKTTWSFAKLFKYAINGIISFSTAPLKIATVGGMFLAIAAIIYMIVTVIQRLVFGVDVPGYASIIILILLLGGTQLFTVGVLGEYLAKAFIQGKNRPIYIAREILDKETKERNSEDSTKLSD